MIDRFGTDAERFTDVDGNFVVMASQTVDIDRLGRLPYRQQASFISQKARAIARAFEREVLQEIEDAHG